MINLQKNSTGAEEHFLAVKDLIQSRIGKIITTGYINRNPNRVYLDAAITNYLEDLLIDENLIGLINAEPEQLPHVITSLRTAYPDFIVENSHYNKILRNVFISHCYNHNNFSKLNFIKHINIDTCPYCNRNYTYYLSKVGKLKPQIDHFFPKSKYPFLAASFYNLIPSCHTCNGFGAKEELDPIEEDLVSPYLLKNSDFKFTYRIKNINFLNPLLDKTSVKVNFLHKLDKHLEIFQLEKFYDQHADHVLELIIKSKISYSEKYRDYLQSYAGFQFSESEIDRMILGNYSEESQIHKRPLAKLYQDIGRELNLIK